MFAGLIYRPDGARVLGHEREVMKDATEHATQRLGGGHSELNAQVKAASQAEQ
jgi:hypothetical protein